MTLRAKMKMRFIFYISLALMMHSCGGETAPELNENNLDEILDKVYNETNLPSQKFSFDASKGKIIEGENGTKIWIEKNSFVDESGKIVTGKITIELKEALYPVDMIMANLTTVSNGKALETGGMIYINATSISSGQLSLADNKSMLISLPTDSLLSDMSLFEGVKDSLGNVNWVNPVALDMPVAEADTAMSGLDVFEKAHNILYSVDPYGNDESKYPQKVKDEVSRIAWEGTGLIISKDSTFEYAGHVIHFYKQDTLIRWNHIFKVEKGNNSYVTDQHVNYIFEMKKLGWANIDRLLDDPRTEDVELITEVSNHGDFNYVYTTLVTQKMFLPGYQKKDDSYCFTHGDYEATKLPIGVKATIIATARKDNKTYFAFKTITIKKDQKINLELTLSDKKKIETTLEHEI
jgi:hypothetical protein